MGAIWVGIDVSKQRLDVAIRPAGETLTVDNDEAGIKALSKELRKWSPQLIVLEATGGHEYASAYSLTRPSSVRSQPEEAELSLGRECK
jgi:transposase